MNIYHGAYRYYGSYQYYKFYDAIVIATTESEALGLLLMRYPDTVTRDWDIDEIEFEVGVTEISSQEN